WKDLVTEVGSLFRRFKPTPKTRSVYQSLRKNQIRSHDTIVSWNYDTIFEHSLRQKDRWNYDGITSGKNCLRILKPHGSSNWLSDGGRIYASDEPVNAVIVAPTHLKFVRTDHHEAPDTGLPGHLDQSDGITAIWKLM